MHKEVRTSVVAPVVSTAGLALCALVVAAFVGAFWHSFRHLWNVWQTNEDYSAGQLVPLAAAYMIWIKRDALRNCSLRADVSGVMVSIVGIALNAAGLYYLFASLANIGLVITALGIAITLLGRDGFRKIWFPLLFLFLMIPLPNRIHHAVLLPLQSVGAKVSVAVLEVTGVPTERFGHVLEVGGFRVAVAEACSGLRMAVAFLVVACVTAHIVNRPPWQKIAVVASAVPIALICNVVRIVFTACLYNAGKPELAQGLFHDAAGLLMMPIAVALIIFELWVFKRLTAPSAPDGMSKMAPGTGA
jgi:exosortase